MFGFLQSKKGFTLVELMIGVLILAVISAVAVPMLDKRQKKQRVMDCDENCMMIETIVKQMMAGMMDNGKQSTYLRPNSTDNTQWMKNGPAMFPLNEASAHPGYVEDCLIYFNNTNQKIYDKNGNPIASSRDVYYQIQNWSHISANVRNAFKNSSDGLTINGKVYKANYWCYELTKNENLGARLIDIRCGYRPDPSVPYNEGCKAGYYLKNKQLGSKFIADFMPDGEIPVCPFDKTNTSHYYIFADGSVVCMCEACLRTRGVIV